MKRIAFLLSLAVLLALGVPATANAQEKQIAEGESTLMVVDRALDEQCGIGKEYARDEVIKREGDEELAVACVAGKVTEVRDKRDKGTAYGRLTGEVTDPETGKLEEIDPGGPQPIVKRELLISQTTCTDYRGNHIDPTAGGWFWYGFSFRVNDGSVSEGFKVYDPRVDAYYVASGSAARGAWFYDFVAAMHDSMALENENCTKTANPTHGWNQNQGNTGGQSAQNSGHIAINYTGDTPNGSSLLPTCLGGPPGYMPPAGQGYADATNVITSVIYDGTAGCNNWALNQGAVGATGTSYVWVPSRNKWYISETDITINERKYICLEIAWGCADPNPATFGEDYLNFRELISHEIMHAEGVGHTCGDANCSLNLMNAAYPAQYEPSVPARHGLGDILVLHAKYPCTTCPPLF